MDKKREHIKEMFPRISDIEDPEIREKVVSVWLEAWTGSDFDRIEDAGQWEPIKETLTISNVEHTNQVVECGIAMAEVVERGDEVVLRVMSIDALRQRMSLSLKRVSAQERTDWLAQQASTPAKCRNTNNAFPLIQGRD